MSFPMEAQWELPEELLCLLFICWPLSLPPMVPLFCFPLTPLFKAVSRLPMRSSFSSQEKRNVDD